MCSWLIGLVYTCFILSNQLAASVVGRIGAKWTMFTGSIGYFLCTVGVTTQVPRLRCAAVLLSNHHACSRHRVLPQCAAAAPSSSACSQASGATMHGRNAAACCIITGRPHRPRDFISAVRVSQVPWITLAGGACVGLGGGRPPPAAPTAPKR